MGPLPVTFVDGSIMPCSNSTSNPMRNCSTLKRIQSTPNLSPISRACSVVKCCLATILLSSLSLIISFYSTRNSASPRQLRLFRLPSAKVLCCEIPVNQLIQHCVYIVRTSILVIQVVGMFPYVDGQQRFHAGGHWHIRIAGFDHLELVAIQHEPRPAAAELGHCRGRQLFLARIQGAEGSLDLLLQHRGWFTTALRLHTAPVKRVVPCLRCIIEDCGLVSFAGCFGDDFHQRQVGKLRSGYKLVQIIDISLVMLAEMEADRICRDYRVQRVIRVGPVSYTHLTLPT